MSQYQERLIQRLASASSSLNRSQEEEQQQSSFQRGQKRHISQVTKQKIEEFKKQTESFLQGQKVPELSDRQKELIRQQQIDTVKDVSDLRKLIVSQKNEFQRNEIQKYQNKYKIQQEKKIQQNLERKVEVEERTKQRSNDYQKKFDQKIQLLEERLKQEQIEKEAKTRIPGIKDIFFKQFIKETEEKSPIPSRTSEIAEDRLEDDEFFEEELSVNDLQQNKKDLTFEPSNQRKATSLRSKFSTTTSNKNQEQGQYQANGQGSSTQQSMRGKSLSQGVLQNQQYPYHNHMMLGEGIASEQFHRNNEKIKSQYYTLNRFNQFQKEIQRKLKLEQEKLINQKKIKNEKEQIDNFVLSKDMWEKIIEADKNKQPFRLPNFGIEKTPVYKMQQNDEEEKRKKIDQQQRIKQGVFIVPQKQNINFKNIVNDLIQLLFIIWLNYHKKIILIYYDKKYKGVKNVKMYSTLFNTSQYTQNNLLESSLKNSIRQARLVWGSNFLKDTYPTQPENNSIQSYQYSIQEEPALITEERSDTIIDQVDNLKIQKLYTDKDSYMNKSQSGNLPHFTTVGSNNNNHHHHPYFTEFTRSKYKDTNDQFYSSYSTKEKDIYTISSPKNFQKSPKRYVYTSSHYKIKLY